MSKKSDKHHTSFARRNAEARSLSDPRFRKRVVQDKTKYNRKRKQND